MNMPPATGTMPAGQLAGGGCAPRALSTGGGATGPCALEAGGPTGEGATPNMHSRNASQSSLFRHSRAARVRAGSGAVFVSAPILQVARQLVTMRSTRAGEPAESGLRHAKHSMLARQVVKQSPSSSSRSMFAGVMARKGFAYGVALPAEALDAPVDRSPLGARRPHSEVHAPSAAVTETKTASLVTGPR